MTTALAPRPAAASSLDRALVNQLDGRFAIETIERYLPESLDHFDDVKVQTFLPDPRPTLPLRATRRPRPVQLEPS